MSNWISSWLEGIVVSVILITIIEMIIPEGNNKKYIKTTIGIYILFVIISPIMNNISDKQISIATFEEIASNYHIEVEEENSNIFNATNKNIEDLYIQNIKTEIQNELKKHNYNVNSISIEIETSESNYGKIKKICLDIVKNKETDKLDNTIKNIENINVNISSNKEESKEELKVEYKEIIDMLNKSYGIKEENIYLNSLEGEND